LFLPAPPTNFSATPLKLILEKTVLLILKMTSELFFHNDFRTYFLEFMKYNFEKHFSEQNFQNKPSITYYILFMLQNVFLE